MDDPEEWEAEAETVIPQPSGNTVFSLRLPNEELSRLRKAAKKAGLTTSEYVRRRMVERRPLTLYYPHGVEALSHGSQFQVRDLYITHGPAEPQSHQK